MFTLIQYSTFYHSLLIVIVDDINKIVEDKEMEEKAMEESSMDDTHFNLVNVDDDQSRDTIDLLDLDL